MGTSERSDQKRRAILGAARTLLVKQGFQDIVLDDVARQAGVAKGTLYLYFRNKDELLAAAFEDLVTRLGERLDELIRGGRTGKLLLDEAVSAILEHFDENRDFISQFTSGRLPGCGTRTTGKCLEKLSENVDRVARVLERCRPDPVSRTADPQYHAIALVALCRAAMLQKLLNGSTAPLTASARSVLQLFLYGAGGRK